MAFEKTINLTGAEICVKIEERNCDIRNDSAAILYASRFADIVPDADDVLSIPPKQAAKYCGLLGSVYLLGTGKVQICGNNHSAPLFKCAASPSGEGGVSQMYVDMQDESGLNAAKKYTDEHIINPNLIINSNLKINQRGQSEYVGAGYGVDGWQIVPSSLDLEKKVTILSNGGVEISTNSGAGLFADYIQMFETPLSYGTYTASGIIDGEYHTFTGSLSGSESVAYDGVFVLYPDRFGVRCYDEKRSIQNLKLEPGLIATPYVDPDEALELVKCQRNYCTGELISVKARCYQDSYLLLGQIKFPVKMRIPPTVTITAPSGALNAIGNWTSMQVSLTDIFVHAPTLSSDGFSSLVCLGENKFAEDELYIFGYTASAEP